jgi:putative serine protease PepD
MASPYPSPVPASRRRGLGLLSTVLVSAVVAAVVGAFAGLAGYALGRSLGTEQQSAAAESTPVAPLVGKMVQGSIAEMAARTLPAVVSLVVEGSLAGGSGSGFVIRPDGYILTNNHVVSVADGNTVEVVFSDGEQRTGTIVGTSPSYDLAVVKVDRTGLPALTLGDSDQVRVGDLVVAIGAPLGLDGTVTSGIVSALDRPVMAGESASDVSYINAVQTDAAINPGNSGGPLLDTVGNVIGVNSAIATLAIGGEAGNIGLGFAIPSNSASRVADEIIATGTSKTPLMGVQLDPAYSDVGARVSSVTAGSGAEAASLREGDIVLVVDGRPIADATELVVAIRSYAPGDTIEIEFERDGRIQTAELVLGDDSKAK